MCLWRDSNPQSLGRAREYERRKKEWVLRRFQQPRSYRDEIETRNREEIPFPSRVVSRYLSAADGP